MSADGKSVFADGTRTLRLPLRMCFSSCGIALLSSGSQLPHVSMPLWFRECRDRCNASLAHSFADGGSVQALFDEGLRGNGRGGVAGGA